MEDGIEKVRDYVVMSLEEKVGCGKIPEETLFWYADALFETRRSSPILEHIEALQQYGSNWEKINATMNSHISGCHSCTEYVKEHQDDMTFAKNNIVQIFEAAGEPLTRREIDLSSRLNSLNKDFGKTHIDLQEQEPVIHEYIKHKIAHMGTKKIYELNVNFEKHIQECAHCIELLDVGAAMRAETYKRFGR